MPSRSEFELQIKKKIVDFSSTLSPLTYKPLKVVFDMSTPIMLGYPFIHFDGLIEHFLAKEALGEDFYLLPSRKPIDFNASLPEVIKRAYFMKHDKKDYVCHASVSIFQDDEAISSEIVYKRFDDENIDNLKTRKKQIRIDSGMFRSYRMVFPYNYSKSVVFYANGDLKYVSELLEQVEYLGKKPALGYGQIRGIEIKENKEDFSLTRNNKTMRPIPLEYINEHFDINTTGLELALMSYKTPYWSKKNVTLCVIPFSTIALI